MQARARKICVIRLCTKLQRAQTLTTLDHTFTKLMQHATVLFSASNLIVFFEVVWQHLNINVCLLNINVPVITLPILLDCIIKFIISDYNLKSCSKFYDLTKYCVTPLYVGIPARSKGVGVVGGPLGKFKCINMENRPPPSPAKFFLFLWLHPGIDITPDGVWREEEWSAHAHRQKKREHS